MENLLTEVEVSENGVCDLLMDSLFSLLQLLGVLPVLLILLPLQCSPPLASQHVKLLEAAGVGVLTDDFEDAQEVSEVEEGSLILVPGQLRLDVIQHLDVILDPCFDLVHALESGLTA